MKRFLASSLAVLVATLFTLTAFNLNDQHLPMPLRVLAIAGFFCIGFSAINRVVQPKS